MSLKKCFVRFQTGLLVLSLLVFSCAKMGVDESGFDPMYSKDGRSQLAIATLRTQEGVRILRLDPVSVGYILNPEDVEGLPDGTRVFLQYQSYSSDLPSFCTESVYIEWFSPVDTGTVSLTPAASFSCDPVDILTDWMTSLEDDFLTIHYLAPSSGKVRHTFTLAPGVTPEEFILAHDAHGDTEAEATEGLVCFPVGDLLPDTGGETVTLTLTYYSLEKKQKHLSVEYRSPE